MFSALPPKADSSRTSRHVRKVPILLQKSKIGRPRKSREGRFLDAAAAARFSGANTKAGGRFCMKRHGPPCRRARNASAVLKFSFVTPKRLFQHYRSIASV